MFAEFSAAVASAKATAPKKWFTYEQVAAEILGRVKEQLALLTVEGNQLVPGNYSGTDWALDAKGVKDESGAFVVIECRRYTTSKIKQTAVAALAYIIRDTGAVGGLIVSPLGLQQGAAKVAADANILAVTLNANATPEQFVLSFLGNLMVGISGLEARIGQGHLTPVVVNNISSAK